MGGLMNKYLLFFLLICLFSPSSQATRQTGGGLDTQKSTEILQGLYLISGILKTKLKVSHLQLCIFLFFCLCVLQSHSWQPGIKNPYRGVVVWPVPENIEITVTLFKVGHSCFALRQACLCLGWTRVVNGTRGSLLPVNSRNGNLQK